jgi:ubiquinone/menaquinone biosynthesis C-methylase UbiE
MSRKSADGRYSSEGLRKRDTEYEIPNDLTGLRRLDVQHYLMRFLWQGNFESDVDGLLAQGIKVLDVGCGYGTWVNELSKKYPKSTFTGIDTAEYLPEERGETFVEHNIQEALPFADESFDFVHARFLLDHVTEQQWQEKLVPELLRVTKPNGWIELVEFDVNHKSDGPQTRRLTNGALRYLASKGYNGLISKNIPGYLKGTGKVETVWQHDKIVPLGRWAGAVGALAIQDTSSLFHDMRKELSHSMDISLEVYDGLVEEYKREVEQRRTFFFTHRYFAQKLETKA